MRRFWPSHCRRRAQEQSSSPGFRRFEEPAQNSPRRFPASFSNEWLPQLCTLFGNCRGETPPRRPEYRSRPSILRRRGLWLELVFARPKMGERLEQKKHRRPETSAKERTSLLKTMTSGAFDLRIHPTLCRSAH